ncbi:hypothetical protein EW146_g8511 [Bondarzewia mesenterica]|uniref:NAD(P)-binding protein n=1 Tax=Bondarzewia mesenterica TaxID=1095465 RepID=A0A4S4LDQ4_9AGAM|nr:hypothetical protein EW146_g8511 [Bondarzewia mesenterica]
MPSSLLLLGLSLSFWLALRPLSRKRRSDAIPNYSERVLVIGASSGIGRAIAHIYAERGAKLCIVGRRGEELETVRVECEGLLKDAEPASSNRVVSIKADFSDADDMIRVRTVLEQEWGVLDTLVVSAGVSALQPLLHVAGVDGQTSDAGLPTVEGVRRTADIALAATKGNYLGPLVSAVTLVYVSPDALPFLYLIFLACPIIQQIPFMSKSPSPSIHLISSLAAVFPAPTRTLYTSTKAASLMLYRSLSIEHPNIAFSYLLPSTVEGDFRASAVDSGPTREADPNKHGLKRTAVAARAVRAIDNREGIVFMPQFYWLGHILGCLWPSFVERRARRKYNFPL